MLYVALSSIIIKENRQRQEFEPEALQELADSIEAKGLMHPIVVRQEGNDLVLVAGERRLKALKQIFELGGTVKFSGKTLGPSNVPVVLLGELGELEAEEAELDENLRRKDLTWQELAAAHARLHALRQKQAGQKLAAHSTDAQETRGQAAHSVLDTAKEVYPDIVPEFAQDKLRKELIVSRHLDNPLVAKAKNADEAYKILKREEQRKKNLELAQAVGQTFSVQDHTVLNMNCMEWLRECPSEKFDVILTDPPYGMGAHEFGDAGGKMTAIEHQYDDSHESWQELMGGGVPVKDEKDPLGFFTKPAKGWCAEAYRVAKPMAHAYVFCDFDRFHELKEFMQAAGWYVFRTPFIVHKLNSGRVPLPNTGPRRQWECILYAIKGNKPVTNIYPDVIPCQGDDNLGHGAQKPVELYTNLLMRSVKPGDEVLDSFAGTGTILPAAHALKCKATAIEMSASSYGICLKRLKDIENASQLGLDL